VSGGEDKTDSLITRMADRNYNKNDHSAALGSFRKQMVKLGGEQES
jgi:hypothetical protein